MPRPKVLLEREASVPEATARELARGLAARGFECSSAAADLGLGSGLGSAPTVLLFDRCGAELLDRIGRRTAGGRARLLAVGRSRAGLGDGDGWRLLAAGASDVLCLEGLADPPEVVAARLDRWAEVDRLLGSPLVTKHLVGACAAWRSALGEAIEAARFGDSGVLLLGESGTGKELVARLIHTLDARADKGELVTLDCTTVHPELSGSEFFGHERGAFTHAVAGRDGAFALAHRGTLFLDEVGELPLRLQAELLRVVQEGQFKRVGGNAWNQTRFRLVCATHRDLAAEIGEGRFRADFYHRIAAVRCTLPPLADRREDIPLLVHHFLAERWTGEAPEVEPALLEVLTRRAYPGNVRDLRQLVGRILQRHVGPGPVTLGDLPPEERPPTGPRREEPQPAADAGGGFEGPVRAALARGQGLREITHEVGDTAVRLALEATAGNVRRAAERLGVTDRALQMRRAAAKREAVPGA
jgi:transcriptional regulator with GAF, ATPase, and Fis domain